MPLVDIAITVIAGLVALRANIRWALATVVATVVLSPNLLTLPHSPTSTITLQRVAVAALLVNLLVRIRRGQLSGSIFEITPVHAVFLVFLGVSFILGVSLAQPFVSTTNATHTWSAFLDEFVFFVTGLAAFRSLDDLKPVLRIFSVLLVLTAAIAAWEHFSGRSWASYFFRGTSEESTSPSKLAERGGDVRVRVASSFSLAYTWWAVAVLPLLVAYACRWARRLWLAVAGIVLVVLAQYWTHTRSIAVPLLLAFLVIPLLARNRAMIGISYSLVAVMVGLYALSSTVSEQFSSSIDQGSIDVRFDRIPPITSYVADHALGGLGLTGISSLGFKAVDSSYILVYADIGVIGVTLLALLYATSILLVARGLFARDAESRIMAAATTLGVITLVSAGFIYDAVTQVEDQRILYLLVAFGIVVAERSVGPPRWLAFPTPSRVAAVVVAVGGGYLLYATAPTHVAVTYRFSTLSTFTETTENPPNIGKILIHTACNTASLGSFSRDRVEVTCRDPALGAGQGELRIQAPDEETVQAVLFSLVQVIRQEPRMSAFRLTTESPPTTGRPTALRTAPVWLPMVIGAGALLIPGELRRRRRRRRSAARPRESDASAAPRRPEVVVGHREPSGP